MALWDSIGSEFWHRLWLLMVTLARIRKSNLEKDTFSNDQSYFAFFSNIDPVVLLGIGVNEG